ncbi:site-specific DNA-methyltransferase [Candidatus Methylomicrobium oryzae]|uniref:site-specific DNA-methyltransferase n=1 Tax=Candidatus Methylomicrobium oryzae TaxID=2802053 RepID=UPI00192515CC|nr:site-specific DNA-methyltransferase [Methylomicrobium sp. RS1]MBL1264306.1 site-specific DNA-methyltransferase [Methylomicrobium sp. RS1]
MYSSSRESATESLPSAAHYRTLNKLFGGTLKPYEELQAEYQAVQRQNRRFGLARYVLYTNVWDFKPAPWYPGKHLCEKPLELMRHIVEASSRPGDMMLDAFDGSGSMAIACRALGRGFVGCENEESPRRSE